MNMRFATIIAIAAASSLFSLQAANAQEGARPGARFSYAPNTWRIEQPRTPSGYGSGPQGSVRHGSMPRTGSNFLGLTPQALTRPQPQPQLAAVPRLAPIAQQSVNAQPSFTNLIPQLKTPPAFQAQFGNPLNPPVVAQAPAPMQALPQTPLSNNQAVSGKLRKPARSNATTAVSGVLRPRRQPPAQIAKAAPPIESYGKGVGYVPGAYLPMGSGMSSTTSVSGVIKTHRR